MADDGPDKIAMTPAAIEVRARMAREWAARVPNACPWAVRQHFDVDFPQLLATVLRLAQEKRALLGAIRDLGVHLEDEMDRQDRAGGGA